MTFRPTKRALALGGGALVLFGVGTNVQAGWVLAIAALLAGLMVVGLVGPLRALRGIEVSRRAPRSATAGQAVAVSLDVTNASGSVRGLIGVDDRFCGRGAAVVGLIRPNETRQYLGRRSGARRGVYRGGPCTLESGAPFGVARVRRTVDVGSPIVVYPRTYEVGSRQLLGLGSWRAPAPFGDPSTVRDYRRGDPLKHVHWRTSARRGELVVREFDTEKRADVTVVAEVPADPDVADAIASVACSLAISFIRGGSMVRMLSAHDGRVLEAAGRSYEDVLEWGARLEPAREGAGRGAAVLPAAAGAAALVCVLPASSATADRLAQSGGARSTTLVVLVGSAADAGIERRLRGAGAEVAVVAPEGIAEWFAAGSAAS